MARDPPLLESPTPALRSATTVTIGHVQLRDVIICPKERGVVNYIQSRSIVEHNLLAPEKPPRVLADLAFFPNTLASMEVPGTDHTLLAAGGQDAEIHLSLLNTEQKSLWQFNTHLQGSINNSILLTSLSLTDSNESSVEPRMAVSNNDRVVMFFDVPVRARPSTISQVGAVRFNDPVNHSSISPDGRTLLSVGDSSKVFLHRLTGGAYVTSTPIATLTLPPTPNPFSSPALVASFSTAFSADGSKYAVAAQEGSVAVWDVRSTRPLKVFHTDKTRGLSRGVNTNTWLSEDPQEWSQHKSRGPGWSARNVKFGGRPGRELMMFTEHTSLIHVIDARTFETEEILHMPAFPAPPPRVRPPPASQSQ
ncbi:WD40-repeat-containing domain protein, partial [Mycena belliarum]